MLNAAKLLFTGGTIASSLPLFVGDYSTNNVSQWPVVQTKNYNDPGSGYTNLPAYSINIGSDATYGKAALFEVRSGDWPGFAGGERAEVQGGTPITGGDEGDVRWYHFATKFPVGFPTNHHDLGWAVTNQWHGNGQDAASVSPPVEWNCSTINGRWTLTLNRYNAGPTFINDPTVWDTPINAGVWHDIKMEIKWSASDATGYVRLWWNGVRQTLTGGVTTYFSRTLVPGQVCYYKEGFYRQAMANTVQIYHAGFRAATSESGL